MIQSRLSSPRVSWGNYRPMSAWPGILICMCQKWRAARESHRDISTGLARQLQRWLSICFFVFNLESGNTEARGVKTQCVCSRMTTVVNSPKQKMNGNVYDHKDPKWPHYAKFTLRVPTNNDASLASQSVSELPMNDRCRTAYGQTLSSGNKETREQTNFVSHPYFSLSAFSFPNIFNRNWPFWHKVITQF